MKIVVVGSSNTDMVLSTPGFPLPGQTLLGDNFFIAQGGKGANQAVAAARAGAQVVFIARLGNDELGERARELYEADNIDTSYLTIDAEAPTGVALILVDKHSGQNSIVVAPGANEHLAPEHIELCESAFEDAKLVLLQLETPLPTVLHALKLAKKHQLITVLNPAPAAILPDDLLGLVDILTPNETEAQLLTGIELNSDKAIREAAEVLLSRVNSAVVVTLGEKGVFLAHKSGLRAYVPSHRVQAVDTTAAGDVFNGYFATAVAANLDIEDCVRLGNRAAAHSVTIRGAQNSIPKVEELPLLS